MTWLLVLILVFPGQEPQERPVGEIVNEETCRFAGDAMARALLAEMPMLVVGVRCTAGEPV